MVGKPPFETQSLQDTYKRIKRNEYYIPSKVSHSAQLLIIKLLRPDPTTRPNLQQVLEDDFFKGFTPNHLPISSLTMAPRFATTSSAHLLGVSRKPLNELNTQEQQTTGSRRDKAEFLEKVSKRRSLGVRVCGGESKLIQPGEAIAEELKDEDQEGMTVPQSSKLNGSFSFTIRRADGAATSSYFWGWDQCFTFGQLKICHHQKDALKSWLYFATLFHRSPSRLLPLPASQPACGMSGIQTCQVKQ